MNTFLQITAIVLAGFSVCMSLLVAFRLRQPTSPAWWGLKVFAGALAPFLALAGALSFFLGIIAGPLWIVLPGVYATFFFLIYLYRVKISIERSPTFDQAFGQDWRNRIKSAQQTKFLSNATPLVLPAVPGSDFILEQDIPFCTIPGTNRILLCDVWQPAKHIRPSGLAFIYFHGSAWYMLDKDFGTRPFFKHLVAQGHVIMDVGYRLFPETDMTGMVHDVFRAVRWMKTNAYVYKVNADRIVTGGGSAGAHLALLAAYTYKDSTFIPKELQGTDLSVHAVVSAYGPVDLEALYYHTGQHISTRKKPNKNKPVSMPAWIQKMTGEKFHRLGFDKDSQFGTLPKMLGCHPDECPGIYASFSPITYIHKECPPTFIIQGQHDLIVPESSTKKFFERLSESGVPVVMYSIPQTDHAFDLVLPVISPVAHTAFYTIERFLALQVSHSKQEDPRRDTKVSYEIPYEFG